MADIKFDFPIVTTKIPKRVRGRIPVNTSIKSLGITRDSASLLTEAAAKLTKSDLVILQADPTAARKLGLSTRDVNSIRSAFAQPIDVSLGRGNIAGFSISCCCCTPCCCAAAALEIRPQLA